MQQLGRDAVAAQGVLATAPGEQRNRALLAMAAAVRARASEILAANERDMRMALAAGLGAAGLDRLRLDTARIEAMARGLDEIAA
jgi:glutamate-5-semialdehyde dehydrogenase